MEKMNESGIKWEEFRRETLMAVFPFGEAERSDELIRCGDVFVEEIENL
jgi:hypothetical protein